MWCSLEQPNREASNAYPQYSHVSTASIRINIMLMTSLIWRYGFVNTDEKHRWWWSGGAKVSCILRHQGVQLILAYSWAMPAILVAGKGRGGCFYFFFFFTFIPVFLSYLCLSSSLLLSLLSLFSLSLGDGTK